MEETRCEPLRLVGRIEASVEGGRARADFKVEPIGPSDEGDFEYIAVAKVPSLELAREGERPLAVHIDRDVTHIEIFLLERKGEALDEIPYEVTFPDGEVRAGLTDGGGYLTEDKQGKVEKIRVKFTPPGHKEPVDREVWIEVGDIATEEGVKRRLGNLGYKTDPLAEGIRQFEIEHGLPPDGEIDDELRRELSEAHDKTGILRPPPERLPTGETSHPPAESGGGKPEHAPSLPEHPPVPIRNPEVPPEARLRIDFDAEVTIERRRRRR